jgi:hypothetical protein
MSTPYDSDDRFDHIPSAGQCWVDGYRDSDNGVFDQERNEECIDKGNQYYEAWLSSYENAGNTKDMCIINTDS